VPAWRRARLECAREEGAGLLRELVLRDIGAMRRFYCDVLGAEHVAWRAQFGMSHLRVGTSMIRDRAPLWRRR